MECGTVKANLFLTSVVRVPVMAGCIPLASGYLHFTEIPDVSFLRTSAKISVKCLS